MKNFIATNFKNISSPMGEIQEISSSNLSPINLGIGDLDIHTDEIIIEKAFADARLGHTHYTNPFGYEDLREEIVNYHSQNFENYHFTSSDVLVTSGACHALYLGFRAILDPFDEVIVFSPYFPVYLDQIKLAGGVPKIVKTKFEDDFQIDELELLKNISSKTKAILINTPSNPTGVCYNEKSLNIIKKVAKKYDLLVIADEVYDFYSFDQKFVPMFTLDEMDERTLSICSFSKDFAMTGWRIGYAISKIPNLIKTMEYINESIVYSAPSISQRAGIYALQNFEKIKSKYVDLFQKRIEYTYNRVKNIPFLDAFKPQGGIYLFVNIEKTSLSSKEFAKLIFDKLNIKVLAGEDFGDDRFIRIACTVGIDKLKEAFDRIENFFDNRK